MAAQPSEVVVGNMVRRVLKVIKDEEETVGATGESGRQSEVMARWPNMNKGGRK
jgi:hypothetical protein